MKYQIKLLFILLAMTLSTFQLQAARYEIFNVFGDVKVIRDGSATAVTKYMELNINDKLRLGNNSKVGIKDNVSKAIYYGSEMGEFTVISIISKAKKDSKASTAAVGRILGNEVIQKNICVAGVVNRGINGSNADDKNIDTLPSVPGPNSLRGVINDLLHISNFREASSSIVGSIDIVVNPIDSVVSYKITVAPIKESIVKTIFVNVIMINSDELPRFLFCNANTQGCMEIFPGDTVLVDWYPMVFDPDIKYFLIISEEDYPQEKLQNLLSVAVQKSIDSLTRPKFISTVSWNSAAWLIPASTK